MTIDERKFVVLTILTYLVCGGYAWFTQHLLVFPFPLNEYVFLAAALWMGTLSFRKGESKWLAALLMLTGLFGMLATEFFWSFFKSADDLVAGKMSFFTDLFNVLYYTGLVVCMVISVIRSDRKYVLWTAVPAIAALVTAWLLNNVWLGLGAFVAFAAWSFSQLKNSSLYYIWILLAVLELFKWGSLVLH